MEQPAYVTVIMPIRNEAGFIQQTLGAVLVQDYPADRLQIIVADGMSNDGTREVIADLQKTHSNLELVDNPGMIVATGLNAALGIARGEIIVRVDGHTTIAPDYVRQCVAELEESGADNVGGRMAGIGLGDFGRAVTLATSSPFGIGGARFHYSEKREWVDTVYLGAWRREVFSRIGLFDEELVRNQDDEFNYRLLEHGGRILLSPLIKSEYVVRGNPRSLFSQYFQYGFWKVRVMQKHPRQMRPRHFVPPAFVFALAGLTGLSLFLRPARKTLALLLALYACGDMAASRSVVRREGVDGVRELPLVFPLLHLGYGSGFLWGLFRFAGRWNHPLG